MGVIVKRALPFIRYPGHRPVQAIQGRLPLFHEILPPTRPQQTRRSSRRAVALQPPWTAAEAAAMAPPGASSASIRPTWAPAATPAPCTRRPVVAFQRRRRKGRYNEILPSHPERSEASLTCHEIHR